MNKPMNPLPQLNPDFVMEVRRKHHEEIKDLERPEKWKLAPCEMSLVTMWKSECPTMAAMLDQAKILEPYAEQMYNAARTVAIQAPGDFSEALSEALKDMIPSSPEMERTWLRTYAVNLPLDEED